MMLCSVYAAAGPFVSNVEFYVLAAGFCNFSLFFCPLEAGVERKSSTSYREAALPLSSCIVIFSNANADAFRCRCRSGVPHPSIHPSANPPPNIQVLLFVLIPLAVLLFALEPVLASRGGGGAGGPLQVAKAALTDRVSPLALFWVCLGGVVHVGLGRGGGWMVVFGFFFFCV